MKNFNWVLRRDLIVGCTFENTFGNRCGHEYYTRMYFQDGRRISLKHQKYLYWLFSMTRGNRYKDTLDDFCKFIGEKYSHLSIASPVDFDWMHVQAAKI